MIAFKGNPNFLVRLIVAIVVGVAGAIVLTVGFPAVPPVWSVVPAAVAAWVFGTFVRSGLIDRQVAWRFHFLFLPLMSGRIDLTGFRHFEIGTQSLWTGGPDRDEVAQAATKVGRVSMSMYAIVLFAKLIAAVIVPWTVPPVELRGRNRNADEVTLWRGWSFDSAQMNLHLIQQNPSSSRSRGTPASRPRANSAR